MGEEGAGFRHTGPSANAPCVRYQILSRRCRRRYNINNTITKVDIYIIILYPLWLSLLWCNVQYNNIMCVSFAADGDGTMTLPPRSTNRGRDTVQRQTAAAVTRSASYWSHTQPNSHIILLLFTARSLVVYSLVFYTGRRSAATENRKGKYCSTSTPPPPTTTCSP